MADILKGEGKEQQGIMIKEYWSILHSTTKYCSVIVYVAVGLLFHDYQKVREIWKPLSVNAVRWPGGLAVLEIPFFYLFAPMV